MIQRETPQAGDDLGRFTLDYISIFLFQSTLRIRSDKRAHVHIPISIHAPSITERHKVTYHFNFIFQPTR